jgi:hypothetical protein
MMMCTLPPACRASSVQLVQQPQQGHHVVTPAEHVPVHHQVVGAVDPVVILINHAPCPQNGLGIGKAALDVGDGKNLFRLVKVPLIRGLVVEKPYLEWLQP